MTRKERKQEAARRRQAKQLEWMEILKKHMDRGESYEDSLTCMVNVVAADILANPRQKQELETAVFDLMRRINQGIKEHAAAHPEDIA